MRLLPLALPLTLATRVSAEARRDRTVTGDVIKAARFLQSARIDDAKTLLDDLEKRAPDNLGVKWLDRRARVPDRRLRRRGQGAGQGARRGRSTAWPARPRSSLRRRSR